MRERSPLPRRTASCRPLTSTRARTTLTPLGESRRMRNPRRLTQRRLPVSLTTCLSHSLGASATGPGEAGGAGDGAAAGGGVETAGALSSFVIVPVGVQSASTRVAGDRSAAS